MFLFSALSKTDSGISEDRLTAHSKGQQQEQKSTNHVWFAEGAQRWIELSVLIGDNKLLRHRAAAETHRSRADRHKIPEIEIQIVEFV